MQGNLKFPHLRVCVNSECNFSCFYCKPGGESSSLSPFLMTLDEIQSILKIARDHGFDCVKFTGGEPLMRDDIVNILRNALKLGFSNVQIITNGYHLSKFVNEPPFRKLSLLTVSLDSLSPETFSFLTKRDCLDRVQKGIIEASKLNIPLRINTVLCKFNKDELLNLIDFASSMNAELKIHELLQFRIPNPNLWRDYFVPPKEIAPMLERLSYKKEIVYSEGGYGSPMTKYYMRGGLNVLVYDSSYGVRYDDICKSCNLFPCQDGLYALKVTHEGKLKRCWGRDDINLDILTPLKEKDQITARALLEEAIETFTSSKLHFGKVTKEA